MQRTLSIVIPVYNEERTIVSLLDRVADFHSDRFDTELIIVDDGSRDASLELIRGWLKNRPDCRAKLIVSEKNSGKGAAVRAGIAVSAGDAVIIQDADLEYDPNDYEVCAMPIFRGECDVVYGSREESNRNRVYSSPGFYLGALALTFWIDLLYHAELTDEPTCYKTFRGDLIRAVPFEEDGFEWEPEITAKMLRLGCAIREVPIAYFPRSIKEGKKIRLRDGLRSFLVALLWRFRPLRSIRESTSAASPSVRRSAAVASLSSQTFFAVMALVFAMRVLFRVFDGATPHPVQNLFDDLCFAASSGAACLAARLFLSCIPAFLSVSTGFLFAVFATQGSASGVFWLLLHLAVLFFLKFAVGTFALFLLSSVFFAALAAAAVPSCAIWLPLVLAFLWMNRGVPLHLKGFFSLFACLVGGAAFFLARLCLPEAPPLGFSAQFFTDSVSALRLSFSFDWESFRAFSLGSFGSPLPLLLAFLLFAIHLWTTRRSPWLFRLFFSCAVLLEVHLALISIRANVSGAPLSAFLPPFSCCLAVAFLIVPALALERTEKIRSLFPASALSLGFLSLISPILALPLLWAFAQARRCLAPTRLEEPSC